MDIQTVVETLSSEMKQDLLSEEFTIEKNITYARVYNGPDRYGVILLFTNEEGNLLSCKYYGKYPSLSPELDGVSSSNSTKDKRIVLELDTIHSIGEFLDDIPPRLMRLDGWDVPFLGMPADRTNAEREEP